MLAVEYKIKSSMVIVNICFVGVFCDVNVCMCCMLRSTSSETSSQLDTKYSSLTRNVI